MCLQNAGLRRPVRCRIIYLQVLFKFAFKLQWKAPSFSSDTLSKKIIVYWHLVFLVCGSNLLKKIVFTVWDTTYCFFYRLRNLRLSKWQELRFRPVCFIQSCAHNHCKISDSIMLYSRARQPTFEFWVFSIILGKLVNLSSKMCCGV